MKKRILLKSLISLTLLMSASLPLFSQSDSLCNMIDKIFASFHNAMPGAAVAVSYDGKTIYSKAFGLSNLELTVPNTTQTIFECGSVSKQFTAAAVMLLIQEGKISLDDDVRKYIPELPVYDQIITIRHLLSHTSGLKDWGALYSLTGWPRTTRAYTQSLSADIVFRQKSLNFTPGSRYSYSNSNYVMLVQIAERVSEMSLADFTSERIFKPLGMSKTQWRDDYNEIVPGRSVAYTLKNGMFFQDMPFENVYGPGGLLTTTEDLLKWNRELESGVLFTDSIAKLRITPGNLTDGSSSGYAAGLMIGEWNGFKEISHSGSTAGYRAWLAWYPEKRLSVAILSNYALFSPVSAGRDIASVFLGTPQGSEKIIQTVQNTKPMLVEVKSLKDYTGKYYSCDIDVIYEIDVFENGLRIYRMAGDTFKLKAVDVDEFLSSNNGRYRFKRDKRGRVTGFTVSVSRAENVPFERVVK